MSQKNTLLNNIYRFAITVALLLPCMPANAQTTAYHDRNTAPTERHGNISGRVMTQLVPLAGADVVLMRRGKVADKTQSDKDGNYSFNALISDSYDIKASKEGHRTRIMNEVPVFINHITHTDLYLPVLHTRNMDKYPIVEYYEDLKGDAIKRRATPSP